MRQREASVWFFDENGKLFSLDKGEYLKIAQADLDSLALMLLDPDPRIRLVAKQRFLLLEKSDHIVCRTVNPSRKLDSYAKKA